MTRSARPNEALQRAGKQRPPLNAQIVIPSFKKKALDWLGRGFEERASWLVEMVKVDPRLDRLRGETRFQDLLRRMRMPPVTSR